MCQLLKIQFFSPNSSLLGRRGCLIYYFMSIPKYEKQEATLVEEFKEWKGKKDKNKEIKSLF